MKITRNNERKILIGFFVAVISVSMLLIVSMLFLYGGEIYSDKLFHWIVLLTFVFGLLLWNRYYSESIVDPINLLFYVQFIFLGSNSVLKILYIESKDYFIGYSLDKNDYNLTNALISLGVMFFLLGAIIGVLKRSKIKSETKSVYYESVHFRNCGILLLLIGTIGLVVDFDLSWLDSAYKEFGSTTIWKMLWTMLLPVSGFLLMTSKSEKYIKVGLITLLLLSFLFILMGNRGYSISLMLVVLWLYDNSIKKVSKKKFMVISFVVIILTSLFFEMKPLTLIQKFEIHRYINIDPLLAIVSLLEEGSVTYRTLIYTVKYVPKIKKFQLGASYFWGLTTILPNIFGTPVHPAHYYYEGPSEWLRWNFSPQQAETGQGFGFSMIGEAYFNFGVIGVSIIMFLFGYIVSRLSKLSKIKKSEFNNIILSIVLSNIIWGVRNPISSIIRNMTWQILSVIFTTSFIKMVNNLRPKGT